MTSRLVLPFADVGSGIKPSSGAKLFFFEIDGVTPKDTFSDQLATPTPNANPVIANSTGVFGDIYISGDYKVTLQDKNGSQAFGGVIVTEFITGNLDVNLINNLSQAYEFSTVEEFKNFPALFPDGKTIILLDRGADFKKITGVGTGNDSNIIASTEADQSVVLIKTHKTTGESLGVILDDSFDNTAKINTAAVRGEKLTLDNGIAQAVGLIPKDSFTLDGQGGKHTSIKIKTVNSSLFNYDGVNTSDVQISNLKMLGLGKASATLEAGVTFDGAGNSRRDSFEHVHFSDFSNYALQFSGGWGNKLDSCILTSNNIGLDFKVSPQLGGWSGSGFTMYDNYFSACNTGVQMEAIWNFTSINSVIEDCVLPINQLAGGTPAVWINTWFESNAQSPALGYSNIFIGGRLEGGESPVTDFYGNMNLPVAPFDTECITEISRGIRVFRDTNDEKFSVDGQGVKAFKPHKSLGWDILDVPSNTAKQISVGLGNNALGGGIQSETDGNDGGVWKEINQLTASRHFLSNESASMTKMGVKIQGQGSSSLTGLGFVRTVFSSGVYETGGSGATNFGDRWQVHEAGHFSPMMDNTFDIGLNASSRVRDIRVVNAPIVGSDYRIKPTVESIPQAFLDFAMSVEIKQYKLFSGKRFHYGIVITEEFLTKLSAVYNLDSCAAFCQDIFLDKKGTPVDRHLFGKPSKIEYTDYVDDKFMLSVDKTTDFTLSLGDDILATNRNGVLEIKSDKLSQVGEHLGLSHTYNEVLTKPLEPIISLKNKETQKAFIERYNAYLVKLDAYNESLVSETPILDITYGGVILGDLWQVRYDEWQNILLEAMRRKISLL